MEYLITAPEETDWKINETDFVNNLLKQWPELSIKKIPNLDDFYSLEWFNKLILNGALHRDGQGVSLDGYLEDCARFAIWFCFQVPQTQKLVFYDQGYNSHIELQEGTTESEIVAAFVSANYKMLTLQVGREK